jgi:hypothetical protein
MPIGFAPTAVAVDLDTLRSEASSDGWWESSGGGCWSGRGAGRADRLLPLGGPGGDAYVLALIPHDWPDEKCVEILRKCADAMEYGARRWVIEKVVQNDLASTSLEVALLDLNMLICFGARERTGNDYVHLLETTGFTNVTVHETGTVWRVIEGQRSD